MPAAGAREPGELHAGRRGDAERVVRLGDLQQHPAPGVGGEPLADRGDRGDRRLVAGQQQPARRRWAELDPAVLAAEAGVRAEEGGRVAGADPAGPPGGGAAVAVQDQVDVHLGQVRAGRPDGVRADRVTPLVGQGPPPGVPVGPLGQAQHGLPGQRQRQLDPLVVAVVGEPVQVGAREGDPDERRAEPAYGADLDVEEPPGRDGQGLGHDASRGWAGAPCRGTRTRSLDTR